MTLAGGTAPEPPRIAVLLPAREILTARKSGAIGLSLRDFTAFSRYRAQTVILGGAPCDLADVPYRQLTGWRRWWLRDRVAYGQAAADFARRQSVALVEVQNRPTILAALRRRLPKAALALYLHNDPQTMEGARSAIERRRVLAAADAVFCVSAFVREQFLEGLTDEAGKVRHISYGLDMAQKAQAPKEKIIAFAGRIIREKGVIELIEAFALAAPSMPEWRLALAGEDKEGLLKRPEVAAAITRLGDRLSLLGHLDHGATTALFERAEIAATPALWREPFGRTTLEAMAAGCAVVSSGSGGSGEILEDCGLIVDPLTPARLAEALERLGKDAALRQDLQKRGAARAMSEFDIRAATARLDAARDQILSPS
jgi:UDP-glucose:(glucosyl)LPS alpha-1,2-glucosyltransferase